MGSLILDTTLGLFLAFFVLSLAASALMSIIQKSIHLRARNLRRCVRRMFGGHDEVVDRFFANPLITPSTNTHPTDTIDAEEFIAALARAILPKGAKGDPVANLPSAIAALPDGALKERLSLVVSDEFASRDQTVANLKTWFENAMRGVSEAYETLVRRIMYVIAAVLVIGLNVNAIAIGEALYSDAALRETLAASAQKVADNDAALGPDAQLQALECVRAFGGFPIGWGGFEHIVGLTPATPGACQAFLGEQGAQALKDAARPQTIRSLGDIRALLRDLPVLLLGWLITIIAVAQGAPFWFDLLRSATGRGGAGQAGRKPAPASQAAARAQ
ncbi:MAG: hypothetical protein ACE5FO_04535 [Parvularculaceae bacterium]